MTLAGAVLGFLGVVIFARWLLVGGDEGTPVKRARGR
jgi:multisubunit Na+/H+ antiporter MnhF subunit